MSDEVLKCLPDDPNRCQATIESQGQCRNLAYPGSKYCLAHGGNKQREADGKSAVRNFHLTRWQSRIQSYSESASVKSLREEVGILRMLLEQILEKCTTDTDLVLSSNQISDLVLKIERLVTSCHALETKTGSVLDKSTLMQIATEWVTIISAFISGEKLEEVSNKLLEVIRRQGIGKD